MITKTNEDLLELIARLDKDLEGVKVEPVVYDVEPKVAKESAVKAVEIAGDLLLDIAELLIAGGRFLPELSQDEAISAQLREAQGLFEVASRQREFEEYSLLDIKYKAIKFQSLMLWGDINILLGDADSAIERGFTSLSVANYITEGLTKLKEALQ